ncbi:MAG: ATP-dependent Clp protease ATP-binding subunit [Candidatus Saccharibacteria bacterium]
MDQNLPPQFDRFTENAKRSLEHASMIAAGLGSVYVGTEHLLLGVLKTQGSIGSKILAQSGVTLDKLELTLAPTGVVSTHTLQSLSQTAKKTIALSLRIAQEFGQPYAGTEHLLYAILTQKNARANVLLREISVNPNNVRSELEQYLNAQTPVYGDNDKRAGRRKNRDSDTPALDHFGIDLTEKAKAGELDPMVGRKVQLDRMISILNRRQKNNPVLIGEPGVGKTAIVEGLAERIINEEVPDVLHGKRIVMLDMATVIAGTKYRGEFEERLKKLIEEVTDNKDIILFIDELHTVVGAGSAEGAIDAANILKPALSRGMVQVIGATTLDEYRKHIEKDAALERRFQPVIVPEATVDETIEVLKGLKSRYEDHHQVVITDEAIEEAAKLAKRYISDRFLPDKAIDLIDEAASLARIERGGTSKKLKVLQVRLEDVNEQIEEAVYNQDFEYAARLKAEASVLEEKIAAQEKVDTSRKLITVDQEQIARVISQTTGIPLTRLVKIETEQLKRLDKTMKRHVIGQDEAVESIAKAIRRSRTGIAHADRPIGSFIFLGPTGVGKTELARVLAQEVFHDKDALIKVDMSEFMERHNVSRLVGAPAGYVGYEDAGQLTEQVRRRPYSLILFDEIEKAHPDVFNMLLQILEDGQLTDAKGRAIDFRNTIIIMTSNVGAKSLYQEAKIGFTTDTADEQKELERLHIATKSTIQQELKRTFRPEFLNRVDHIVIFKALSKIDVRSIIDLQLKDLGKRLREKDVVLKFAPSLKALLIKKGYDVNNGARPMRRAIQTLVEDPLAEALLHEYIVEGDVVTVKAIKGEVKLEVSNRVASVK